MAPLEHVAVGPVAPVRVDAPQLVLALVRVPVVLEVDHLVEAVRALADVEPARPRLRLRGRHEARRAEQHRRHAHQQHELRVAAAEAADGVEERRRRLERGPDALRRARDVGQRGLEGLPEDVGVEEVAERDRAQEPAEEAERVEARRRLAGPVVVRRVVAGDVGQRRRLARRRGPGRRARRRRAPERRRRRGRRRGAVRRRGHGREAVRRRLHGRVRRRAGAEDLHAAAEAQVGPGVARVHGLADHVDEADARARPAEADLEPERRRVAVEGVVARQLADALDLAEARAAGPAEDVRQRRRPDDVAAVALPTVRGFVSGRVLGGRGTRRRASASRGTSSTGGPRRSCPAGSPWRPRAGRTALLGALGVWNGVRSRLRWMCWFHGAILMYPIANPDKVHRLG